MPKTRPTISQALAVGHRTLARSSEYWVEISGSNLPEENPNDVAGETVETDGGGSQPTQTFSANVHRVRVEKSVKFCDKLIVKKSHDKTFV